MTDTDFALEVDAEEQAAKLAAIADLEPLWQASEARKAYEKEQKRLDPSASDRGKMGRVRAWLLEHDDEDLEDTEHGIVGKLESGGVVTVVDSDRLSREHPMVWKNLDKLGVLVVDVKRMKEAIEAGLLAYGDVAGYVSEEARTLRLKVQRIK